MEEKADSGKLINVLYLEDDLNDIELLHEILQNAGYLVSMDIATSAKEFEDLLRIGNYDIILADNSLPDFDAFSALRLSLAMKPGIPFICVSGTLGEEKAVELLKQGAMDYVSKDRLTRLATAVERAMKDIQRQKEREEAVNALNDSESKYSRAFLSSPYSIAITSAEDGRFIEVNDAFISVSGFTREEVLTNPGIGINMWVNKDEQQWVISTLRDNCEVRGKEFLFMKKSGKIITGLFSARMISVNNEPCIISSINDITERKRSEAELFKAKEKAEESDRLKSVFLSNMSHEIRTPMNGILGFAKLLKEPDLSDDEKLKFIEILIESGERMLNTLNDIIDSSRIESGKINVNIRDTDINGQVEFIYNFFIPEIQSKGIQFSFKNSLPSKEAVIKTDPEKIITILTNLVKNAVKFTNQGSIELGYEKKGEFLRFFVKDTGIGISAKQKEVIFERFRQGSESNNRNYEGCGLGLSIAKSYVELLEGEIWVESEEGKGSIFYFTIPYKATSLAEHPAKTPEYEENIADGIRNLKILVAEDDEISFSLLTRKLQNVSSEILRAETGIEAVGVCRDNPDIDLILMDIRMPGIDGLDAARQIRQFNKGVVIIAQTTSAFPGDREKAIAAGCNDHITKPINQALLFELIRKHCINKH